MVALTASIGTAVYREDQQSVSSKLKIGKNGKSGYALHYGSKVLGDGNCLFRSISELLKTRDDHSKSHLQVRREIVDHVLRHPHRFMLEVDANDADHLAGYAARMREDAAGRGTEGWGGSVEIDAAADLYGFVVRVWILKLGDLNFISDRAVLHSTYFPHHLHYGQLPKIPGYPLNEFHLVNTMYDVEKQSHYEPAHLVALLAQQESPDLIDFGALRAQREKLKKMQAASEMERAREILRSREERHKQNELNDASLKNLGFEPGGKQIDPVDTSASDAASATLREAIGDLTSVLRGLDADDSENRGIIKDRIRHLLDLMPQK